MCTTCCVHLPQILSSPVWLYVELGKIYENVLFFGDVLLRMPDITKKVCTSVARIIAIAVIYCVRFIESTGKSGSMC